MHLVYSLVAGGAECQIADLAAAQQRSGSFAPLVCAWRKGGVVEERLAANGVPVVVLGSRRRPLWMLPWFLRDLWRIVSDIRASALGHRAVLIHAHLSDSALLAVLVGIWLRIPVVITQHSTLLVPVELRPGSAKQRVASWLFTWSARRAAAVVAVSAPVREVLLRECGLDPTRVVAVDNGVRYPPPMARARAEVCAGLGIGVDAPLAICVGRLAQGKGHEQLLTAFARVAAGAPDARLLLVGDGPLATPLRAQAAALGIADRVCFAGHREDIGDLLAAADAFVTASDFEGISLAILEAMAHGLPVLSAACPGNRELLADGVGMLVAQGDAVLLAEALAGLLADPILRARQGAFGRRRLEERYTFDRLQARLDEVYRAVLAGLPPTVGGLAHEKIIHSSCPT